MCVKKKDDEDVTEKQQIFLGWKVQPDNIWLLWWMNDFNALGYVSVDQL